MRRGLPILRDERVLPASGVGMVRTGAAGVRNHYGNGTHTMRVSQKKSVANRLGRCPFVLH